MPVSELRQLQQDFMAYLTAGQDTIMGNVTDQGRIDRKTRLDIYHNAYHVRLVDSIETDHPVLARYLGDDLFGKMATGYIRQYPSHYTSLRHFCDCLPAFLEKNEPFRSHPIIAELAAFERTLLDVFDAADSYRAAETDLYSLPAEKWPAMKLVFHPSVRVFEAHWNSVESWQALKEEKTPPAAANDPSWWILWRNSERLTEFQSLATDGFVLYQCFRDNFTFADACELLQEHLPADQIGMVTVNILKEWFGKGLISAIPA